MITVKNGVYLGTVAGTRLVLVEESGDTLEHDEGGEYRVSRYVVMPLWPSRAVGWVGEDLAVRIVGGVVARWRGQAHVTLDEPLRVVQRKRWGRTVPAVEAYVTADAC